ncbi:helicase HerA-like domain-containing protein [Streptomyces sp. B21-101]|uniref:helicase HerA-like domain-containing protein n=1 Tax=Streptomyces sp. B21-101 TaxID=3039415 RepID=UPI002FF13021
MSEPTSADDIAAGYAFSGPALDLGALLWEGRCLPDAPVRIPLPMLNRHGLVAGATGTGRTRTLQLIAEQLSAQGVPVFLADVKGDLSGISAPGEADDRVRGRAAEVGQKWTATGLPAEFYALGGLGHGVPVRATVTAFGPVLLSKVLQLNRTQEQSLGLIFHYADQKGLELFDLLLFADASKAFLDAITQTVRLIRSKGVGVFFVTQTPKDVPGDVLAQLGNRVQHALRAFTPDDQKALEATVKTFPESSCDLEELLTGLGTGDAVVTVLSERGAPTPVAATRLRAPESLMGPVDGAALDRAVRESALYGRYAQAVDRGSAFEKLSAAARQPGGNTPPEPMRAPAPVPASVGHDPSVVEQVVGSGVFKSLARSVGTQLGREITRSLFGTTRRRR